MSHRALFQNRSPKARPSEIIAAADVHPATAGQQDQQIIARPPVIDRAGIRHSEISLLLPYRPPYDWAAMIRFLKVRAIAGLEVVTNDTYSRVIAVGDVTGSITVGSTSCP